MTTPAQQPPPDMSSGQAAPSVGSVAASGVSSTSPGSGEAPDTSYQSALERMRRADAAVVEAGRIERELLERQRVEAEPVSAAASSARNAARKAWLAARKAVAAATDDERAELRKLYPERDHGGCCIFAATQPCVCRASYSCPLHGGRCEGSHD